MTRHSYSEVMCVHKDPRTILLRFGSKIIDVNGIIDVHTMIFTKKAHTFQMFSE